MKAQVTLGTVALCELQVEEVGGESPVVSLMGENGEEHVFPIDEVMARKLAARLYMKIDVTLTFTADDEAPSPDRVVVQKDEPDAVCDDFRAGEPTGDCSNGDPMLCEGCVGAPLTKAPEGPSDDEEAERDFNDSVAHDCNADRGKE